MGSALMDTEHSAPVAVASRRAMRNRPSATAAAGGGGGQVRLSMGYRADCDKCVRRVPGHYSHVVPVE